MILDLQQQDNAVGPPSKHRKRKVVENMKMIIHTEKVTEML